MANSFENWQNFCREVLGDRYREQAAGSRRNGGKGAGGKTPAGHGKKGARAQKDAGKA